ncbi:MAG: MoxR family ATPase [Planctomycetia bacterium]|nr:MoxR family ATPase [Planctomycetia bacterium]
MAKNQKIPEIVARLEENIASAVYGKRNVIRYALVALFAGEHLLLEDVPGVGKTLLARSLAKSLSSSFKRIQFTPDLIPADITGGSIFNPREQAFEFFEGPIFANIVLADEISRTTPRTQSALLEAMSEHQVSCDGTTRLLPPPFMVIATENPIEFEGTFPLPESQLDRFLLRVSIGYPKREDELAVLRAHQLNQPIDTIEPVLTTDDVLKAQQEVRQITLSDEVRNYILDLVEATRTCAELFVGVSPRGGIAMCRAAQSLAFVSGRTYVVPDDVKNLAVPVFAHRIIPKSAGQATRRENAEGIIQRFLGTITCPG